MTYLTESSIKELEEIKSKLENYKYQSGLEKYDDTILKIQEALNELENVKDYEDEN